MQKILFSLIITLVCFLTPLQAQEINYDKPLPESSKVTIGVLDNGLTYYIRENDRPDDIVELRLVVNAGSILEDDDQQGLAHFMEHMNFNGTKNFKKNELVSYLQSIGVKFGADLNAYTSFDKTVFILPIPTDDSEEIEKGFQVLEDWAHNALLKPEMIDAERGVVLEEYRLGLGAGKRMRQVYLPVILKGSRYAERLPIGKEEILKNFDYDVLKRFYNDWYRPGLMAVIAIGDLDTDVMLEKIKEYFSDIPTQENPRPRKTYSIPNHEETYIAVTSDPEAYLSRVSITYMDSGKREVAKTVGDYKENLTERLFTIMINNRLERLRNSSNPPFVNGYSYHGRYWSPYKEAYRSIAITSTDGQLKALKALLVTNKQVKEYGFRPEEFTRAKKELLSSLEAQYKGRKTQESGRYVNDYINNYLYDNPIPGIEWRYSMASKIVPTIKLEKVSHLIDEYLHNNNRTILFTGPTKEGENKVTKAEIKALLQEVASMKAEPYEAIQVRKKLVREMPEPGKIIKSNKNEALGTTRLTLDNGVEVVYKKTDFKDNQIVFKGFSFGGASTLSNDVHQATNFAFGGLTEAGISDLNKSQLHKLLAEKNVSVSPYISGLTEGVRGNSTTEDMETMFQLIYLNMTELNKDQEAFDSYIQKRAAFLANLLARPQIYFAIQLGKYISQNNPRYTGFPTPEKLKAADYDLAYKKYKELFADAGDFTFYFIGDIPVDKFKTYVKQYLGGLPGTPDAEDNYKVYPYRPLDGTHKKVVRKGTAPKSRVIISFYGETEYSPEEDYYLNSLGDILTIKLTEILREQKSGVYGVGARGGLSKLPYGAFHFRVAFPCGPEHVESLIDATMKEIQSLVENGPTVEDLNKIKKTQLAEYKEDMEKNSYWLNKLTDAARNQTDATAFLHYKEMVNSLTAKDIHKVAKKCLTGDHITAILYPEK